MRLILLLALSITITGRVRADQASVWVDAGEGVLTLTFDTSRIATETVKRLIRFSPHSFPEDAWPVPITACTPDDPAYLPCGSWDIHAPNFLANAEVNLRKNRLKLERLDQIPHPKELDPVFARLNAFLAFTTWLTETKYEFAKLWDTEVLRRKYETLGAGELCPAVLNEIEAASSPDAKWKLVSHDWHNCLIHAFWKAHGGFTKAGVYTNAAWEQAWEQFLAAYGIKEVLLDSPSECCDEEEDP